MGQDTRTAALIIDTRATGYWTSTAALAYLPVVGPTAWAIYNLLCAGREVDAARITAAVGVSWVTVQGHITKLADAGLIRVVPQQAEDGRTLPPRYELLDVAITPVDVTQTVSSNGSGAVPDLWALRPLEAALAELPTSKNRLAVVARLYAMRFDVTAYPFDFARFGKLARAVSGGATRLCQIVWTTDPTHVRGAPIDMFTAVLSKEMKVTATATVAPHVEDDPQMLAYAKARANSG